MHNEITMDNHPLTITYPYFNIQVYTYPIYKELNITSENMTNSKLFSSDKTILKSTS